jgi:DNA repair protein RadC
MSETYHNRASTTTGSFTGREQTTIREAIGLLESRLRVTEAFTSPTMVKDYCRLQLSVEKDEYFGCLFLDTKHRLLMFERLFRGTIDGASVHPRVVVRRALELNAAATIFTHNHPSGMSEPSRDDINITNRLREALALVDVRVLDHVVVAVDGSTSMAECGLV